MDPLNKLSEKSEQQHEQTDDQDDVESVPRWFKHHMEKFEKLQAAKWKEFKQHNELEIREQVVQNIIETLVHLQLIHPLNPLAQHLLQNVTEKVIGLTCDTTGNHIHRKKSSEHPVDLRNSLDNIKMKKKNSNAKEKIPDNVSEDEGSVDDQESIADIRASLDRMTQTNKPILLEKKREWTERSVKGLIELLFEKAQKSPELVNTLVPTLEALLCIDPVEFDVYSFIQERCLEGILEKKTGQIEFIAKLCDVNLIAPEYIHMWIAPLFRKETENDVLYLCELLKIFIHGKNFFDSIYTGYDYSKQLREIAKKGLVVKEIEDTITWIDENRPH